MTDHDAHNALRANRNAPRVTYTEPKRKRARPVVPVLVTVGAIVTLAMLAPYAITLIQGAM